MPPLFLAELLIGHSDESPRIRFELSPPKEWVLWLGKWRDLVHLRTAAISGRVVRRNSTMLLAVDLSRHLRTLQSTNGKVEAGELSEMLMRHAERWGTGDSSRLHDFERVQEEAVIALAMSSSDPAGILGAANALAPPELHGHLDAHALFLLEQVVSRSGVRPDIPGVSSYGVQPEITRFTSGEFFERGPGTFPYDNPGRLDVYELALLGDAPEYFWQRFADGALIQVFGKRQLVSSRVPAIFVDLDYVEAEQDFTYYSSHSLCPMASCYRALICTLLHVFANRATQWNIKLSVRIRRWPMLGGADRAPEVALVSGGGVRAAGANLASATRWVVGNMPNLMSNFPQPRIRKSSMGASPRGLDGYARVLLASAKEPLKHDRSNVDVRCGWREGVAVRFDGNESVRMAWGDPRELHRLPDGPSPDRSLSEIASTIVKHCLDTKDRARPKIQLSDWELS